MISWFMGLSWHLRAAIILAPFLGIMGFGLTDLWLTKEQPTSADQQPVVVHELQLNGQCVLSKASCMLSAEGINVMLKSSPADADADADGLVRIDIGINGHVRGLQLALVQGEEENKLAAQRTTQTDRWYVEFPNHVLKQRTFTLRLALVQTKRVYLAEFQAQLN